MDSCNKNTVERLFLENPTIEDIGAFINHIRCCPVCRETYDRMMYAERILQSGGDINSLSIPSDPEIEYIKRKFIRLRRRPRVYPWGSMRR